MCVETGVIYDSVSNAARLTGITRSNISDAVHHFNGSETAGGYHWKFI